MTNAEVLHQVEHGYRMASPQNCPPALYDIMLECWHKVLKSRPRQLSFGILPIFENFDCLLHSKTTIWYSLYQDAMKRPTFETLQWKLEDFFTMSDSEYKDASAYWTAPGQDQGSGSRIRIKDQDQSIRMPWHTELLQLLHKPSLYIISSLL